MKKKALLELIENLESRVRFLESRLTRLESSTFRINPVSPVSPTIPPPDREVIRCSKCGLPGMNYFVCTRDDCPTRATLAYAVPSVPDTRNDAMEDM